MGFKTKLATMGLLSVLVAFLILLAFSVTNCEQGHQTKTTYYDVYHAEAPFGVLWVKTRGSFVFGCGSISSQLKESYIIKYWIGNELHSVTLDAEKHPIIVDGTFKLEYHEVICFNNCRKAYRNTGWIGLHIPDLPPINETVTWTPID